MSSFLETELNKYSNFIELELNRWSDIHKLADILGAFAFRGQSDSKWDLYTSLERCFEKYNPTISIYENKERWVLHEFKEKFHLYSNHPPEGTNNFEWLALLQHHGCPTRLLDFTESIYISSYFAVSESATNASIWAVNLFSLRKRLHKHLELSYNEKQALKDEVNKHHVALINKYIAQEKNDEKPYFIVPLRSTKRSIRLSCQQGIFLAPINMGGYGGGTYFMNNLANSFSSTDTINLAKVGMEEFLENSMQKHPSDKVDIIKITIPYDLHGEAIESLNKMNITEESLFPGLDGLARSLIQTEIRY